MLTLFAHAGEEHETTSEALSHSMLESWYVALPLFVVLLIGVTVATFFLSKKSKPATINVLLAVLFVAGVALYKKSAAVSVFALTLGFALALLQVVLSLSQPAHQKKK